MNTIQSSRPNLVSSYAPNVQQRKPTPQFSGLVDSGIQFAEKHPNVFNPITGMFATIFLILGLPIGLSMHYEQQNREKYEQIPAQAHVQRLEFLNSHGIGNNHQQHAAIAEELAALKAENAN